MQAKLLLLMPYQGCSFGVGERRILNTFLDCKDYAKHENKEPLV